MLTQFHSGRCDLPIREFAHRAALTVSARITWPKLKGRFLPLQHSHRVVRFHRVTKANRSLLCLHRKLDIFMATLSTSQRASSSITQPALWLEIGRGRTQHRRRPVVVDRFLIGAGSNCQLQLGGEGMPFIHSLLQVEGETITLEALVPTPELLHNGKPVRSAQLKNGDRIEIGTFELTLHVDVEQLKHRATPKPGNQTVSLNSVIETEETDAALVAQWDADLGNLSAEEIVDRLEQEMNEIDRFESGSRAGVAAMLDAAWLTDEQVDTEAQESSVEDDLLTQITEVSSELERRLNKLRHEEQRQQQHAGSLLEAQTHLADQIEKLTDSLPTQQAPRHRARA